MEPLNDLKGALGATSCLPLPIEDPLGALKRINDSLFPSGATNRLSLPPRTGPLNVLSGAPGSTDLPSAPRTMPPSRTVPACMRSTLLKYIASAFLRSARFLKVLPLSVRSVVTGLTPPVFVLTTGSTTATLLPSLLITLLLTMAFLFTNGGFDTITVVVKLWQMKNPGNQKPNQKTGYGTQSYR